MCDTDDVGCGLWDVDIVGYGIWMFSDVDVLGWGIDNECMYPNLVPPSPPGPFYMQN